MKNFVKIVLVSNLVTSMFVPMLARADSTFVSPATTGSVAPAHLDFVIVVNPALFLRVSTGAANNAASNGTIDTLTFDVPSANVGDGSEISGTGGDLTAGAATIRVYGNSGSLSLNSTTTGPLTSAAGDTIPWSQISVTASALPRPNNTAGFTSGAVPHPAFNTAPAGGDGAATTLESVNKVVRVEGRWTYTYLNANSVPAGTYGATAARNGRVTYTATQL
ncbi:hypothetical protein Pnap_3589 [Polaromonas naphthalenivorans CJ2]|uniref:WxL domain-containing protein n=2 Tax=Polaromonas naphthalenivorans TaxID=216465 RepID=A1VTA7_POLNA|nr:hypothetical protein Pnap_3589 [Polaromonas naphthalenivorans CJ2]